MPASSSDAAWIGWNCSAPQYAPILDLSSSRSSSASRVWLAVSRSSGVCQLVVLKTVSEARVQDASALLGLMDEARLTARMNHPNVVRVHALQHERSLPFLVLEHIAGPSLATLLASAGGLQRFSLDLRIAILVRLLRGLDHVHRLRDLDGRPLRVVHGAVSPENVVVSYDGEVKLIDFGRARALASRIPTLLDRRRLPYAPPEQFSGEPDARGDIFSAGVLLWELVANRPLWGSVPAPTIVRRLLEGDLPRLREATPDVDDALER
ncbi:MAG TPA: serine/threonine-protein kinase, partial [Polyangiaceae bacterium]|nr:serine/threonine-protein kinase [Polyangiaceae bacterium]